MLTNLTMFNFLTLFQAFNFCCSHVLPTKPNPNGFTMVNCVKICHYHQIYQKQIIIAIDWLRINSEFLSFATNGN